jgi:hypothetical protein
VVMVNKKLLLKGLQKRIDRLTLQQDGEEMDDEELNEVGCIRDIIEEINNGDYDHEGG